MSRLTFASDGLAAPSWRRPDVLVAGALVTLYAATRLADPGAFRLWYDEIYSVQAVSRGWLDTLRFIATYDPHPPLWYLVLKVWTSIAGDSYLSLGAFSIAQAISLLVPLFLLVRELGVSPRVTNLVLLVLAVNGYLIGTALELRMYSALATLSLTSIWLMARRCNAADQGVRDWVPLTVVNILLAATQYFGWLVLIAEGVYFLLWRRDLVVRYIAASIVVVLAQLPWIAFVALAAKDRIAAGQEAIAFTARPSAFGVASFYSALTGTITFPRSTTIALVAFLIPVVIWLTRAARQRQAQSSEALALLVTMAVVPAAIAVVASLVLPFSVWGQRHLVTVAVPYVLLVVLAIDRLPLTALRYGWSAFLVAWAVWSGTEAVSTPYKVPAWDGLVRQLASTEPISDREPIYALNSSAGYVVQFYLDREGVTRFHSAVVRRDRERDAASSAPKPYWNLAVPIVPVRSLADLPADRFWVADDGGEDGEAASAWGSERSTREILLRNGYDVGEGLSATVVIRRGNKRRVELFPAWRRHSPLAGR